MKTVTSMTKKSTSKKGFKKNKKKGEVVSLVQAVPMRTISPKEKEARRKRLDKVRAAMDKKYGQNVIIFGSEIKVRELRRVSIYSVPSLSVAIGGGIPKGRITTISGPFSSCKSKIGYSALAEFQFQGEECALIDVEGTYTPEWGAASGIDNDLLLYIRPVNAEEATNAAIDLAREGISFVMLDSIEALSPEDEMGKAMDESTRLGIRAELVGRFLRKMNSINNKYARSGKDGVTLLLINQLRERPMSMGDPEYEPGGRAIGFYSSVQIRIRNGDFIREGSGKNQRVVCKTVKFKVNKNKTFKMLQSGEFDFYTDRNKLKLKPGSFDVAKQLITEGIAWGIIQQPSQGYYLVNGQKIRGIDNTIEVIRQIPSMSDYIRESIQDLLRNHANIEVEGKLETRQVDLESGEILA